MSIPTNDIPYMVSNICYVYIFAYFFSYFLYCKSPSKNILILGTFHAVIVLPILLLLNDHSIAKQLFLFVELIMCAKFLFPNNSKTKVLISIALFFSIVLFTEFIVLSSISIFFGSILYIENKTQIPWAFHIEEMIILLTLFTLAIRLFSKKIYISSKISLAQTLCLFNFYFTFLTGCMQIFIYKGEVATLYYIFMLVFFTISNFICFKILITETMKQQKELSIMILQKEYEKLLDDYLIISSNEESYRQLRHDIVNFISFYQKGTMR